MGEWKEYKLNDIIELIGGGTPKTSNPHYWDGDIPWLSVVDFNSGKKYVNDSEKKITRLGLENSSTRILNKGDIIISARGTVGVIAVLSKDMTFNQSCYGIKAKPGISINEYVYYLLKDTVSSLIQIAHGGVFDTITRDTFKEIDILLPPLPEQRAIASVLSSLDDKIELLHRQNKTLEAMAETLYRQLFAEGADDGWEETTIENVCVKVASGGTPSTKVGEYYNGDINWYSTRELNDTFLYESSTKITNSGLENSSAKMFPENTVLIAIYAAPTVGRLGILANDATFNQAACGFIVDENKICFEYLYLHLLFSRQKLNDIASGSAQQNLNVKIMRNFEILLLPANIIHKFKYVVRPIFRQIKLNTKQIMTLEKLRDTLLPKLISGEVKVEYEDN